MRTVEFQKNIGVIASLMKTTMKDKKQCVKMLAGGNFFYNIWFSGVNIVH